MNLFLCEKRHFAGWRYGLHPVAAARIMALKIAGHESDFFRKRLETAC
jgi:hypothetical protein